MWSEHFQTEVDFIDGKDIPGPRFIVRLQDGRLIELPKSWVVPINDKNKIKPEKM